MFKWTAENLRKLKKQKHSKDVELAYNRAIRAITANLKNKALTQSSNTVKTEVGNMFF